MIACTAARRALLALGSGGAAWAQAYPPNGTDFPTIAPNEGREGAPGLKPLSVPPPKGFDRQVFDICDPFNPRRVAYFIQAPNRNTESICGSFEGNPKYCRNAAFSDLGEFDDRGYIYNMDRAGSGLTILSLTGGALAAATGRPPAK
jgi:hypothetical protein